MKNSIQLLTLSNSLFFKIKFKKSLFQDIQQACQHYYNTKIPHTVIMFHINHLDLKI